MPYEDIYTKILTDWKKSEGTVWAQLIQKIQEQLDSIAEGRGNWMFYWPEQKIQGESFKDAIFKTILRNYDAYLAQLEREMNTVCSDAHFVRQLVRFQSFCMKTRIDRDVSRSEIFEYDFSTYFETLYLCENAKLHKKLCKVTGKEIISQIFCE